MAKAIKARVMSKYFEVFNRGKQGNANPEIKSGIFGYFFYFTIVY